MVPGFLLASALAAAPVAPPVAGGRNLEHAAVAPGIAAADRDVRVTPRKRVDIMRPTAIALLAAGSVSAIGGAVLLGFHGRDNRRRCADDDPRNLDSSGDCRFVHQTLGPSLAMLGGGVLAVAGGITLLSIERRHRRAVVRARLGYNRIVISGRF